MTALDFEKLIEGEQTFGLDISSTRIKAMWITEAGKKLQLRSFGEKKIPASAIVGGIIRRPEIVSKEIGEVIKSATPRPIATPYAICSIPQEKVFLKIESFPNLDKEKLREAVTWKAKSILAMPLEKIYWDWHRLDVDESGNTINILFSAIEKEVVDSYVQAIGEAGIIPLAFEIEGSAAARVALEQKKVKKDNPILMVEVGNSSSVLSIMHKGGLRFNSSVSVGGNQIVKIVSTEEGTTPSEAERYIKTTGLKSKKDKLVLSLQNSFSPLVHEIQRAVSFFNQAPEYGDAEIEDILLYGEGASLKGVEKYLDEALPEQKVFYSNPRIPITPIPQFISHRKIFPHLIVTGLALRPFGKYSEHRGINFLPPIAQQAYVRAQIQSKVNTIVKIVAINLLALVGFVAGGWFLLSITRDSTAAMVRTKESVLLGERISSMSQTVADYNSSLSSVNAIIDAGLDWGRVFDGVLSAVPDDVLIKTMDIYLDEEVVPTLEPRWILRINGVTGDRQTVINFSNALLVNDLFDEVVIPISAFSSSDEVPFQIEARIFFNSLLKNPDNFDPKSTAGPELILQPGETQ